MTDPYETPAPSPAPDPTSASYVSNDDRTMGMLCHLLAICTTFVGPLILWLLKKDQSPFIDHHGREALNFQISAMLYAFIAGSVTFALLFVGIGWLLLPLLFLLPVAFVIIEILAAVAAQRGEWYRYPLCIRFIRGA